jgi:uncharacterized protein YabN with tetrapyrrole methylase and pyrophosphatase domain
MINDDSEKQYENEPAIERAETRNFGASCFQMNSKIADITPLQQILERLRDPERGCDWAIAQTFSSIVPYTIEEAYETADAIARDDMAALRDELGDLLLQAILISPTSLRRSARR